LPIRARSSEQSEAESGESEGAEFRPRVYAELIGFDDEEEALLHLEARPNVIKYRGDWYELVCPLCDEGHDKRDHEWTIFGHVIEHFLQCPRKADGEADSGFTDYGWFQKLAVKIKADDVRGFEDEVDEDEEADEE
jgi:hypothetical protein